MASTRWAATVSNGWRTLVKPGWAVSCVSAPCLVLSPGTGSYAVSVCTGCVSPIGARCTP